MTSRPGWAVGWTVEALLLEVDGVLLDTTGANRSAWRWWASRTGSDPAEVEALAWGTTSRQVVARLAPGRDPEAEVAVIEARRRILLRTSRRVRGAVSLVRSLPATRWAIVTSADGASLAAQLRRLRLEPPPVVVTAADTTDGRPDPAPHLAALGALDRPPGSCLALESSPAGILAARAAGLVVVAVGRRDTHRTLAEAGAEAVRSDLGGVMVAPLDDGRLALRAFREPRILPG